MPSSLFEIALSQIEKNRVYAYRTSGGTLIDYLIEDITRLPDGHWEFVCKELVTGLKEVISTKSEPGLEFFSNKPHFETRSVGGF